MLTSNYALDPFLQHCLGQHTRYNIYNTPFNLPGTDARWARRTCALDVYKLTTNPSCSCVPQLISKYNRQVEIQRPVQVKLISKRPICAGHIASLLGLLLYWILPCLLHFCCNGTTNLGPASFKPARDRLSVNRGKLWMGSLSPAVLFPAQIRLVLFLRAQKGRSWSSLARNTSKRVGILPKSIHYRSQQREYA